jgi:hypothetical protein
VLVRARADASQTNPGTIRSRSGHTADGTPPPFNRSSISVRDCDRWNEEFAMSDTAQPVSYEGVPEGVPLLSSTGERFGTLEKVLEIPSEDVFDGVIVKTKHGDRFVDRDQITEITTEYIKTDLDDSATASLPKPSGTAAFDANAGYGEGNSFREWVHRTFGHGGWQAEK